MGGGHKMTEREQILQDIAVLYAQISGLQWVIDAEKHFKKAAKKELCLKKQQLYELNRVESLLNFCHTGKF